MAALCDDLARQFGELQPEPETETTACPARDVADRAVASAGDCCTAAR